MALLPGSLEPGPSDAHSPGSGSPTTSYTLSLLRGVIPVSDSSQVGMGMFCQWAHWCLTHHLLRKPHSPACREDWDETNSTKQRRGERVHQPILNAACGSRHAFAALCDFTSLVFTLIHGTFGSLLHFKSKSSNFCTSLQPDPHFATNVAPTELWTLQF